MTTIEQWQAGGGVPGSPPWDGTGVPFPVGEDGWPVIPDGELPAEIRVSPGASVNVPHDDPNVAAEPLTAWGEDEFVTFTDGDFTWDGDSWEPYVPPLPGPITLTLASIPAPGDLVLGTQVHLTATASAPPAVNMVRFDYRKDGSEWASRTPSGIGGPPGGPYSMSSGEGEMVAGAVLEYRAANPPGPLADDTAETVYSNVITFTMIDPPADPIPTMGWTVAEIDEFAAEHDPVITFPSGANKAEKIAIIIAALGEDDLP